MDNNGLRPCWPWGLGAVVGAVYLQAEVTCLAALVGALCVIHLNRHVGLQHGVIDMPPAFRNHHAHLAGTLVDAHLWADG